MKSRVIHIGLLMLAVLLSGCATQGGQARPDQCASIDNKDDTFTFKESQITVQKCVHGQFLHYSGECRAAGMLGSNSAWFDVMRAAQHERSAGQKIGDWRIPTKGDLQVIGSCLNKRNTYWTSTIANSGDKVLVYRNSRFEEEDPGMRSGRDGLLIRGGSPVSQQAFAAVFADKVAPHLELERLAQAKKKAQEAAAASLERERRDALSKREAAALATSPKGTIINCTTDSVVPVNTSINNVGFSCPALGRVSLQALQKSKWKITSTERIKAQASDYREDDYGMRNWNGSGVIISIMVEKY